MAYKTMWREPKMKEIKNNEVAEAFIDGCLKEGTDQGWTLHTFTHSEGGLAGGTFFAFIWDTND
jgi:hypothetical protein